MNSRFFERFQRRGLGVGEPRFRAALGKSPALTAAGANQQEFDPAFAQPVANRGHLIPPAQFAKAREWDKRGRSLTFPGSWVHRIRVHEAARLCLEHSLVPQDREHAEMPMW